jgi:hypothetical protein
MQIVLTLCGLSLIGLVLFDAFEAILLPRRVMRVFRPTRVFYVVTWFVWRWLALCVPWPRRRANMLGAFGPLSLLGLLGAWLIGLVLGFALVGWGLGTPLQSASNDPTEFSSYLYLSGVTLFTLGFGDLTPTEPAGRLLSVFEAGVGYGFLAAMLGYLPVLYQAFSRRELVISLLDARAGSPPTAGQFLLRMAQDRHPNDLDSFLAELERWAAELLESHLSFPMLGFYRSQHDNQSWLAALTMILDSCTLLLVGVKGTNLYQAQLTFAMARHAAVDLALVIRANPPEMPIERLSCQTWQRLRAALATAGVPLHEGPEVERKVSELRAMYEPFVQALAERFLLDLPEIFTESRRGDNWQASAWMPRTPGIGQLAATDERETHFG